MKLAQRSNVKRFTLSPIVTRSLIDYTIIARDVGSIKKVGVGGHMHCNRCKLVEDQGTLL